MMQRRKETETSEIFKHNSEEKRNYFRVQPSDKSPVLIQLAEKPIKVIDISAGGIAFKNHNLKESQVLSIKINLPDRITIESAQIKIVSIDENDICHAKFIGIEPHEKKNINQYILKRQIEIAKKKKGEKQRNWHTRI
jgi:c-di-GMP-binding flagellar brake protein YcgR